MGAPAALGAAVMTRLAWAIAVAVLAGAPAQALAERYALVVSGAAGSLQHRETHTRWQETLRNALTGPLGLAPDRVLVLSDGAPDDPSTATAEHLARAVAGLSRVVRRDDVLLVVLMGHGTFDGEAAKFNLVGPDLEADAWNALVATVPCTVVFVNTTGASFPFLERLSAPRRVVITATDSAAQRYETIFAEFFSRAFAEAESDLDKDRRVSVGEAFTWASVQATRWYEQRGTLATERALIDDNGDGVGRLAGVLGEDGNLAARIYLDRAPDETPGDDPARSELIARRDGIEREVEELKRKKGFMPADDYARELERLLVDLARISRRIRGTS